MWSLSASKRAIVVGGCFGMAYTQLTTSAASVEFARTLGGTGLHVGILGAIPVALFGAQLLAAVVVNHLDDRKPLWFWFSIVQRLSLLPAALGPWLWPGAPDAFWLWTLVGLTAMNHGLLHFGTPLWLSWMGDYLPHKGLNRFWGVRHSSQQWSAAAALLLNSFMFLGHGVEVRAGFAAVISIASILGVADILLFVRVPDVKVRRMPKPRLWEVLAAPFRQRDFYTYIRFSCFYYFAAMLGAPFISMYLLDHVGMDLFHVLLLWTLAWVGGAILSNSLGAWAERFGQRPVLILCVAGKSLVMIAVLFSPNDPTLAFWALIPPFMIDAVFNAGFTIASNGYLIKNSPTENRTMFVAAGVAFAGMVGGATSIVAGAGLTLTDGWSFDFAGARWVNFHVLFVASVVLRIAAIWLAVRVSEPTSAGTRFVVRELVWATRMRLWRIPSARKRLLEEAADDTQRTAA